MANSQAAFRAAGGASVRINAGSRLRWISSTVMELEEGTVYVDSGPDTGETRSAAIEIRTALGVVREIGTQFEVRLRTTNNGRPDLRVRVREGLVDLEQTVTTTKKLHRANAGEELTTGADGTLTRGVVAGHGADWDWTRAAAPAFDSDQRVLSELLEWAVREGGWHLEYADPVARKAASMATLIGYGFIKGGKLREGIESGCMGAGLTCRFEGNKLVVTS